MSNIIKVNFYTNYLGNIHILCRDSKIYEVGINKKDEVGINKKNIDPKSKKECNKFLKKLSNYFLGKAINIKIEDLYLERISSFYKDVYVETLQIPYGNVSSYKEIAKNVGRPKAYRAVATALKKNPFPIFVPCHRVIRSDGTIGGENRNSFDFRKKLLNLERRKLWENLK